MPRWKNPLYRPLALLLVGLLVSIGWGIRGNYGHEIGAMFPGAMGALGVCLLSQRTDWQRRVPFFALFGMLGWAFGGSISYMMVIGYTHSGHSATQAYGFAGLFFIGFLWAALGGGSTAVPAVLEEMQLRSLLKPLAVALGAWVVMYFTLESLQQMLEIRLAGSTAYDAMSRQEHPFYWLDSDWIPVTIILSSLLVYQLWHQRFRNAGWLLSSIAIGGVISYLVFLATAKTVGNDWLQRAVQYQGEVPDGLYARDQLSVTNWPAWFLQLAQRPGIFYAGEILSLAVGAILGLAFFFFRYGEFDFGTRLLTGMATGWWLGFLSLPVLGSLAMADYGGLRMTPPRGDNWAGVLGTLAAAFWICWRSGQKPIVVAALICGLWGGIGFSGIALLESILVSRGNPVLEAPQQSWKEWQETPWEPTDGSTRMSQPDFMSDYPMAPEWSHFQNQNWHSFLEQSYGFVNGLAVAIALGSLVLRVPMQPTSGADVRRWENWALFYVVPGLILANLVKNVSEWTADRRQGAWIPQEMRPPWIGMESPLSAMGWFYFFSGATVLAFAVILSLRGRRTFAVIPTSWLGRGQLLTLFLLWVFVIGNTVRALPGFTEGRLLTEGIIYLNALVASVLLLLVSNSASPPKLMERISWNRLAAIEAGILIAAAIAIPMGEWKAMRTVYGDAQTGKRGIDFRLGPNATWKRSPMLKNQKHR